MTEKTRIEVTGDPEADRLLSEDPLALLIGMLLDQQVPMERAFRGPLELKRRLAGRLDVHAIATAEPDELKRVFTGPPAIHRYPGSMAERVQRLCRTVVDKYGGRAERVWSEASDGAELFLRLKALPGFGDQKARIFTAVLAKRFGVRPPGWEEQAGRYAAAGFHSVADIDGPQALARVRESKREMKAAARAEARR